jgi:DNA-binding CsgD family transcriptional regulator
MLVGLQTLVRALRLVEQLGDLSEPNDFVPTVWLALDDVLSCDIVGIAVAGLDGAGLDGAGLDGAGLDGAGLDVVVGRTVACYRGTPLTATHLHRRGRCAELSRSGAREHRIYLDAPRSEDCDGSARSCAIVLGIAVRDGRTELEERDQAILEALRRPLLAALVALRRTASLAAEYELTQRELAVLRLVGTGSTNSAIARTMGISPRTVAKHLEHVYRKLDVCNRAAAVSRTQLAAVSTAVADR